MATAGSSSGGGRARKRGPGQISQDHPVLQIDAKDPRLRKIIYRTASERIPTCKVNNRADHPILQFELNTREWGKYHKLKDTDLFQHRSID
ncbi:hypothetical protein Hanom_Chr17g01582171 [Helianthus anomalus]